MPGEVIAYSPLALGLLTGKYDQSHLPSGPRNGLAKSLFNVKGTEVV
jgi:aryl-alcohol dehydrogenase-like predicted oxidoreductase